MSSAGQDYMDASAITDLVQQGVDAYAQTQAEQANLQLLQEGLPPAFATPSPLAPATTPYGPASSYASPYGYGAAPVGLNFPLVLLIGLVVYAAMERR